MINSSKFFAFFLIWHTSMALSVFASSSGIVPESFDEYIMYSTVRIVSEKNGHCGTGTGFLFGVPLDPSDPSNQRSYYPVLISNKHVVMGFDQIKFGVHRGNSGQPLQEVLELSINFAGGAAIIEHPNADLCAVPIGSSLNLLKTKGVELFFHPIFPEHLFDEVSSSLLVNACSDITMVGYPLGFCDPINNYPLFRSGITASHALANYNGKSEFLIDAPCMPGSSGSPVFLIPINKKGIPLAINGEKKLLGILWGGPVEQSGSFVVLNGSIQAQPIPLAPYVTNEVLTAAQTNMVRYPMNLGFVIKAKEIKSLAGMIHTQVVSGVLH